MMLTATTTIKVVGENTDSLTLHKDEVEMLATIPPFLEIFRGCSNCLLHTIYVLGSTIPTGLPERAPILSSRLFG